MGMKNPVYMDHNATTAVRPEARDAVALALALTGNPSSVHGSGRTARRLVEDARDAVAALVGAEPAWVVFTSGGTEANNLALRVLPKRAPILCSAVEHASVLSVMDGIVEIPVDGDGVVDLGALEALLAGEDTPALVSVMLANNETGVLQPVADVAALAHEHGALIHCDAVQAAGKMAIDFRALGCDLMSLSAHKIGGPSGVGALVVTSGVEGDLALIPMLRGGGQEDQRVGAVSAIAVEIVLDDTHVPVIELIAAVNQRQAFFEILLARLLRRTHRRKKMDAEFHGATSLEVCSSNDYPLGMLGIN